MLAAASRHSGFQSSVHKRNRSTSPRATSISPENVLIVGSPRTQITLPENWCTSAKCFLIASTNRSQVAGKSRPELHKAAVAARTSTLSGPIAAKVNGPNIRRSLLPAGKSFARKSIRHCFWRFVCEHDLFVGSCSPGGLNGGHALR